MLKGGAKFKLLQFRNTTHASDSSPAIVFDQPFE